MILDRHGGFRHIGRQIGQVDRSRPRYRHSWRRCGRMCRPGSGWGGGRRPAPIWDAAGRARTTAAGRRRRFRLYAGDDVQPTEPPAPAQARAMYPAPPLGRRCAGAGMRGLGTRTRSRARDIRRLVLRKQRVRRKLAHRVPVAAGQSGATDSGELGCCGIFMDAVDDLADVFRRVVRDDDPPVDVQEPRACGAGGAGGIVARLRFRAGRSYADADRGDARMPRHQAHHFSRHRRAQLHEPRGARRVSARRSTSSRVTATRLWRSTRSP